MNPAEEKFFESLARSGRSGKGKAKEEKGGGPQVLEEEEDLEIISEAEAEPARVSVSLNVPKAAASKKTEEDSEEPETEGQLTLDVYQTPDDIVVESAIAGVKPEDIDIDVSNDSISIRGERRKESRVKNEDYFYQECYWGRFSRSVILPQEVDPEKASVTFKNGVLSVHLPKLNKKKSRKLKVKFE